MSDIKKQKMRKALRVYIALMLIIIFCSKTIYNISLPKVAAAMPSGGRLVKELEARGVMSFSKTAEVYAASSGRISEILVKKGDLVGEGTKIANFYADASAELEQKIERERKAKLIHSLRHERELAGLAVERAANQSAALALNKSQVQDKLQSLSGDSHDLRNMRDLRAYQDAVADARQALEKRHAELLESQERAESPFDDYAHRQAIADAEREWGKKQAEAENMRVLEDAGAAAPADAALARSAADDAGRALDRAVEALSKAKEKAERESRDRVADAANAAAAAQAALARAEANLKTEKDALASQLDLELQRAGLDIERAGVDLRAAEASLAEAEASLAEAEASFAEAEAEAEAFAAKAGTKSVVSDCQGVVVSIEKAKGQFAAQGEKIAVIGMDNKAFVCEVSCLEAEGRFIESGDAASIYNKGEMAAIKAAVSEIKLSGGTLKISLSCETDAFKGGEYVSVKFRKQTRVYDTLVPNEAVFREGAGSYVWVVRRRVGALGAEHYSVKIKVLVADSDGFYTAISRGLVMPEPVAVSSSKDLAENGRVYRLE